MNKPRDEIRAIWCRQLSGQPIDETERELMRDALDENPDLLLELSDDAKSHALLLSLDDVMQTENTFVQTVMQKTIAVQDANAALTNSIPLLTTIREAPAETSGQKSRGLPVLVNCRPSSAGRARNLQRSHKWLAFLLTLVVFFSAGLIFWFGGHRQSKIADTGPLPRERGYDETPEMPAEHYSPDTVRDDNLAATDKVNSGDMEVPEPPRMATINNSTAPVTTQDHSANSELPNMAEDTPPAVVSLTFVTLTKLEMPVWERDDTTGSRLSDEVIRLYGGGIELTFDDGAVVTLEGPVEFQPRSASLLELRRGKLSATVPKPAIGFTVQDTDLRSY